MNTYQVHKIEDDTVAAVAQIFADGAIVLDEHVERNISPEEFLRYITETDCYLKLIHREDYKQYGKIWPKRNEDHYLVHDRELTPIAVACHSTDRDLVTITYANGTDQLSDWEDFSAHVFGNYGRIEPISESLADNQVIAWQRHMAATATGATATATGAADGDPCPPPHAPPSEPPLTSPPAGESLQINVTPAPPEASDTEPVSNPVSEFIDLIKSGWVTLQPFPARSVSGTVQTGYKVVLAKPESF